MPSAPTRSPTSSPPPPPLSFSASPRARSPSTPATSSWRGTSSRPRNRRANPPRAPPSAYPAAAPVGPPSIPATYNIKSVGLTCGLSDGAYVIAELQVTKRSDHAKLHCIGSGDDGWVQKDLVSPLSAEERHWFSNGVVDHDKKLWWFDLSWGLLCCDPNADHPDLSFHRLPPGRAFTQADPFLLGNRCIGVSDNSLRFVEMARDILPDGCHSEDKFVVIWTLIPDPNADADADGTVRLQWHQTYKMSFTEVWNDTSYQSTRLPMLVPEIVLVNPRHPNVVYFFLEKSFFGVNMASHQVVHFVENSYRLVPPVPFLRVLPWDLSPSIANGLVEAIVPFPEQGGSSTVESDVFL
ncbi:hypothetical protein BS78_10G125500 [Paspalum vaginatum]|nr:hypothetical protein BS78_10G125500 [Paspalum vaginatum]KAJ1259075.1 hypothetical protein BS78_10G125500 [Paspalum vaginatum]